MFSRFFRTHDKKGSGKTITEETAVTDNGHRYQPIFSRSTGFRIHNVPVDLTVITCEITLVATGSNHRLICYRNTSQITVLFCCPDTDEPVRPVRLCTYCLDISSQTEKSRSNTFFFHQVCQDLCCIAFSYTSQIYHHIRFYGYSITIYLDLAVIYAGD